MYAIIAAGGKSTPKDPLYPILKGGLKAFLPIHGKPMVQWVLDTLAMANSVEGVVMIGPPADSPVVFQKPLKIIESDLDLFGNLELGARTIRQIDPNQELALFVSADLPAITPEMVDWVAEQMQGKTHDLYYSVITRQVMEARYPASRRTYVQLKDVEACGGDVNGVRIGLLCEDHPLWQKIIASRKNPLKQASLLGFNTLINVFLHRYTLSQAEAAISKRLGVRGKVLVCPYAEVGMDVDKPFQLDIVRADMLSR
ncbi:MAG TPA: nucleotidyltransferase family protein [Anaerolineaceae bacterium]